MAPRSSSSSTDRPWPRYRPSPKRKPASRPSRFFGLKAAGIRRALGFVTSAYSSYSACRQYLDDIVRVRAAVGPGAPEVDKLRAFYDHPGFIGPMIERVQAAFEQIPGAALLFTAHSIP